MDKNLHKKDIGDWFHDEIEPLSQVPEKHVWENLERQLDKTDASIYKHKFITARKIGILLFFVLVSFATVAILYVNRTENDIVTTTAGNDVKKQLSSDTLLESEKNNYISNSSNNRKESKTKNRDITVTTIRPNFKNIAETRLMNNMRNGYEKSNMTMHRKQIVKIKNAASSQQEIVTYEEPQSASLIQHKDSSFLGLIKNTDLNMKSSLEQIFLNTIPSSIISVTNRSIAKSNKKKINPVSRYSITTFAAPEFAGYILADDEEDLYVNKQVIKKREKHLLSTSGGLLIAYKVNKHLSFQSGIIYSSSNISIDPSVIYAVNDNVGNIKYRYNTSSGFGYILPSFSSSPALGDSLFTRTTSHTLQYISIPLTVKYNFEKEKFSFHPGLGIALNFLTRAKLETEVQNSMNYENESITKLKGMQKVGFSLLFTPELQYKLSTKWSLAIIPYLKYSLSAINKAYLVRTYPYNTGLGLGINYKL